ncbi:MAG: hypothetical protein PUD76_07220 [Clostridia bacterium]|nr:hypothetical protein [Clostridia bacterium]
MSVSMAFPPKVVGYQEFAAEKRKYAFWGQAGHLPKDSGKKVPAPPAAGAGILL